MQVFPGHHCPRNTRNEADLCTSGRVPMRVITGISGLVWHQFAQIACLPYLSMAFTKRLTKANRSQVWRSMNSWNAAASSGSCSFMASNADRVRR
jgi:hypothetical protein